MKRPTIAKLIAAMYGCWGRQVDEHILAGYTIALRDCSDYQVQRAVDHLMRHETGTSHPPTAADVCQRAGRYQATPEREAAYLAAKQAAYTTARQQLLESRPVIGVQA